jgi:hypothetical protein
MICHSRRYLSVFGGLLDFVAPIEHLLPLLGLLSVPDIARHRRNNVVTLHHHFCPFHTSRMASLGISHNRLILQLSKQYYMPYSMSTPNCYILNKISRLLLLPLLDLRDQSINQSINRILMVFSRSASFHKQSIYRSLFAFADDALFFFADAGDFHELKIRSTIFFHRGSHMHSQSR